MPPPLYFWSLTDSRCDPRPRISNTLLMTLNCFGSKLALAMSWWVFIGIQTAVRGRLAAVAAEWVMALNMYPTRSPTVSISSCSLMCCWAAAAMQRVARGSSLLQKPRAAVAHKNVLTTVVSDGAMSVSAGGNRSAPTRFPQWLACLAALLPSGCRDAA